MQMTRSSLRGWGAVALGLVLALVLVAGMVLPAYADDFPDIPPPDDDPPDPPPHDDTPPQMPHGFLGTVTVGNGPAAEGAVVEGFVEGVKRGETNVDAQGRYNLGVGGEFGDQGKTVTFEVNGAQANETATWTSGEVSFGFDLTVPGGIGGLLPFDCFIATAAYGTSTAEEIDTLREFRDTVLLPNRAGAAFVSLYYRVSPPVAEVISRNDFLRAAVRSGFVDPLVATLNAGRVFWSGVNRSSIFDRLFPQILFARACFER